MPRAEARSGRPWAQQVSLPRGRPPVMIVTPAGSWPSPWVSVGVDRIDVVGEERRLRFPQPEGLQAAAEPRAQPAEGLVGRIPGLARFRLRMVFASVAHSRRLARKLRIFARPAGPEYVQSGAPSWRITPSRIAPPQPARPARFPTASPCHPTHCCSWRWPVRANRVRWASRGRGVADRQQKPGSPRYTSAGDRIVAQEPS